MKEERDLVRLVIREMMMEAVSMPGRGGKEGDQDGEEELYLEIIDSTGGVRIPAWLTALISISIVVSAVILLIVMGPVAFEVLLALRFRQMIATFFVDWLLPVAQTAFRMYFAGKFGILMARLAISLKEDDEKNFWIGISRVLLLGLEVIVFEAFAIAEWLKSSRGAKQLADARQVVDILEGGIASAAASTGKMTTQSVLYSALDSNEDYIAENVARSLSDLFGRDTKKIFRRDLEEAIDEQEAYIDQVRLAEKTYDASIRQSIEDIEKASEMQAELSSQKPPSNIGMQQTRNSER